MWQALMEEMGQQQQCLDLLISCWTGEYQAGGGWIHCRRGCSGCCSLTVNCTATEAVAIAARLDLAQAEALGQHVRRVAEYLPSTTDLKCFLTWHRRELQACALLNGEGACGIYDVRPLSCRSLLSTRESSWCSTDFAKLSPEERQAFLEGLDRSAVAFPTHYAASTQEMAQEMEKRALTAMKEQLGFSLYGNLPVLVHLVREHGLAEACLQGPQVAATCAAAQGLKHPFVLEIF